MPTTVPRIQGSTMKLTWCPLCILWLFWKTYNFQILTEMFLLKQAKFHAVRHGPQIVGAGPEDIRGPSMYIATSYDFGCKTWTHESPSQQVTSCSHLIYFLSWACRLLTSRGFLICLYVLMLLLSINIVGAKAAYSLCKKLSESAHWTG